MNDNENSFSKANLIKEQQNDPDISLLYQKVSDKIDRQPSVLLTAY